MSIFSKGYELSLTTTPGRYMVLRPKAIVDAEKRTYNLLTEQGNPCIPRVAFYLVDVLTGCCSCPGYWHRKRCSHLSDTVSLVGFGQVLGVAADDLPMWLEFYDPDLFPHAHLMGEREVSTMGGYSCEVAT